MGELARHWINAAQPTDLPRAIRYSHQAADAALSALAPADAFGTTPRPLTCCRPTVTLIRCSCSTWPSGSGPPNARPGTPRPDTLLAAAAQAADIGDIKRLVAAALANDRGYTSAMGSTDPEKVDTLEMALDLLPSGRPGPGPGVRHLVFGTCARKPTGPPSGAGREGARHRRVHG